MSRTTIVAGVNTPIVDLRSVLQRFTDATYAAMRIMPYPQWRARILQLRLPLRTNWPVETDVVPVAIAEGRLAELMLCFVDAGGPHGLSETIYDTTTNFHFRWSPTRHG